MKWGGTVLAAILLFAWIVSGWYQVVLFWRPSWGATIEIGQFNFYWRTFTPRDPDRGDIERRRSYLYGPAMPFSLRWGFDHWTFPVPLPGTLPCELFCFPLWMPATTCAAAGGTAWALDVLARRRAKLGVCPKCSYSRAGLPPSAPCPECGSSAPSV